MRAVVRVGSSLLAFALLLSGCATPSPTRLEGADVVDLTPSEPLSHLHAPVSGLFLGGSRYWYAARVIDVETTPPGATLDLAY